MELGGVRVIAVAAEIAGENIADLAGIDRRSEVIAEEIRWKGEYARLLAVFALAALLH